MHICMYTHTCTYIAIYEPSTKGAIGGFSFPNIVGDKVERMNRIKALLSSLVGKDNLLPALLTGFEKSPERYTSRYEV